MIFGNTIIFAFDFQTFYLFSQEKRKDLEKPKRKKKNIFRGIEKPKGDKKKKKKKKSRCVQSFYFRSKFIVYI